MLHIDRLVLAMSVFALSACNPMLNWREVHMADASLKAMLPCKPDHGSRKLLLAAKEVEMEMLGCEAGGALFAISHVDLGDALKTVPAQAQWQAAMLTNMQADAQQQEAFPIKGSSPQPSPVRLSARGRRQDGGVLEAQGVWFARQGHLYHAVIYGDKLGADMTQTFFSALELP